MSRPLSSSKVLSLGISFALLSLAPAIRAQTFDKVLIPIAVAPGSQGAYGSSWSSLLQVYSAVPTQVENDLPKDPSCAFISTGCPLALVPGYVTSKLFKEPLAEPGYVAHIQAPSDNVWFHLRLTGASALGFALSFELPVVREKDLFDRPFYLLGVPVDGAERVMLRIYDLDAVPGARVQIRALSSLNGRILGQIVLPLAAPGPSLNHNKPGYLQLSDLRSTFPDLPPTSEIPDVELEITPASPGLKLWAFASVTNNVTQNVMTIVPH